MSVRRRTWTTATHYGTQFIVGDYITTKEVAHRLGITTQGVRARIRSGQLRALKVADTWYVKRSEVSSGRWQVVSSGRWQV